MTMGTRRRFAPVRFACALFCAILALSTIGSARAEPPSIFRAPLPPPILAARQAYVIWINGDADHFVPRATDGTGNAIVRADASDAAEIRARARDCGGCAVVLLHNQRGGDRWYTARKAWGSYLEIYYGGRRVLERSVARMAVADPALVSGLLATAQAVFPGASLHLIYRGHAFFPGSGAPFSYSQPERRYGLDEFTAGIRGAGLRARLASVTFAACSMAYVEVASALLPWADHLIASQVDVVEAPSVGFGFAFLGSARLSTPESARAIARSLLAPFDAVADPDEAMMEYPVTHVDLRRMEASWPRGWETTLRDAGRGAERASQGLSGRYAMHLQASRTEASLRETISRVRLASLDARQVDAVGALGTSRAPEAAELARAIADSIDVFNRPSFSRLTGLSFEAQGSR